MQPTAKYDTLRPATLSSVISTLSTASATDLSVSINLCVTMLVSNQFISQTKCLTIKKSNLPIANITNNITMH